MYILAKLTDKDYEILDYIYHQIKENGYPPTVREICAAVDLNSPATVHARLNKLENAGFIEKKSTKNRSLKIINYPAEESAEQKENYVNVPVFGKITAGMPITAVEQHDTQFPIPESYIHGREIFMLKVSGDSMINAAILDGDYIIVERTSAAENGDIVAALIDGSDATVKTFYKENGHFRLQPENDFMEPIIADDVSILGKVVGVFRMLK